MIKELRLLKNVYQSGWDKIRDGVVSDIILRHIRF